MFIFKYFSLTFLQLPPSTKGLNFHFFYNDYETSYDNVVGPF